MPKTDRPERMLTFASGGWVLVLTGIVALALVAWAFAPILMRGVNRPPGDGIDPATYGFDLAPAPGVALGSLAAGHMHRDLLRALDDPAVIDGAAVLRYGDDARGKYLVPSDRIIGVTVEDEARAYPLVVLNNHEIVNDTLGGIPIAVTYSPLCDSAVVFDRRGADGTARRFGVSGLLLNSNLLMYVHREDQGEPGSTDSTAGAAGGGESLWSQILARAVTGSAGAAGLQLERLPAEVATWESWLERHPGTTVLAPDKAMIKRYRETNYAGYFQTDRIAYPLDREPAEGAPAGVGVKDRCVIVHADGGSRLYVLGTIATESGGAVSWSDAIEGEPFRFTLGGNGTTVRIERSDGTTAVATPALWFAAHAFGY